MNGGWSLAVRNSRPLGPALLALLAVTSVVIAFGTVSAPFLIAGAVLGVAVLVIALLAPLALVAVMLAIGPINLSFMTGGFKALFPQLGGLDMNGIRLIGVTAGFTAYILFEPKSRAAAVSSLGRLWMVFFLYAAATLATSMDILEGTRLYLKLAYPFLTFLIVVGLADSRERLQLLMRYTLAAALIMTLVVNPILVWQGGYQVYEGMVRVGGLGLGENPFSFYATAILFIVFTRFVLRREWRYLLFAAVLLFWIMATRTRIAALGSIAGLGVIGLLGASTHANKRVFIGSLLAAGAVAMVMLPQVLVRSFGFIPTPGELSSLFSSPVALYESVNWQGRQFIWAVLWLAFMASPVVGLGLGSSAAVIRESFPSASAAVAHNEYMRLATDAGLLGVGLFAAAALSWLFGVLRLAMRGDRLTREYAFAAAAGLIAWSLIAVTDNPFDYYSQFTQYIGFLVAGAVVASRTEAVPSADEAR